MLSTKDIDDCIEYRRLKGVAQFTIKNTRKLNWQSYCDTLNGKTKMGAVWEAARGMTGHAKDSQIPNLKRGSVIYENNADKADHLSDVFSGVSSSSNYSQSFISHKNDFEQQHHSYLHGEYADTSSAAPREINDLNSPFLLHDLICAIRQGKAGSSPGLDGMSYDIVKQVPDAFLAVFINIYNTMWTTGELPAGWKHSVALPIPKPNKTKSSADSYRPISLISCLCKLME